MGLTPAGIKITSAEKRFGSCSAKDSLCFSYRLMLYPPDAVDYVVVHELAHIRHKNHGKQFYALIAQVMPDYKERERLLKTVMLMKILTKRRFDLCFRFYVLAAAALSAPCCGI